MTTATDPIDGAEDPKRTVRKPDALQRVGRLARTTAFKIAFLYLITFAALTLGLIAYISHTTTKLFEDEINKILTTELDNITMDFGSRGLFQIIDEIEHRSLRPDANVYLITDFSGNYIAGNVAELIYDPSDVRPGETFPVRYTILDKDGRPGDAMHRGLARLAILGGGYRVLAGWDVEDQLKFGDIIRQSIRGAIIVVVTLILLSGLLLSRSVLRKVDAVAASSRRIVAGDLSRRLPVDGSGDEFDRLASSVNGMLDEIERLHTGLQQVSQNVAHDLKTPLTRVRNRLDALTRDPPTGDALREGLDRSIDECDELIKTFDALLTIARVESHQGGIAMDPVDVSTLLADMAEFYEPAAEDVGVRFVAEIAPELQVRGEPTLLRNMIANLLDNALKYGTGGAARIDLLARLHDDKVQIIIRDYGDGARSHARLTDRFVREDDARSKPGAGLGLSMVKAIAGHHGGTLTLRDGNPGFVADIELPVAGSGAG